MSEYGNPEQRRRSSRERAAGNPKMKLLIRSIFLHPLQAGSGYPTHRKLRFTGLSEKTRSGSTKTHIPETNRADVQAVRHKNVPYCLQKDTPKTRRIRGEIEKTGVIVKSSSSSFRRSLPYTYR